MNVYCVMHNEARTDLDHVVFATTNKDDAERFAHDYDFIDYDGNPNIEVLDVVCESILHGTPIPDNATNGEIADMMFPDVNIGYRYWFPDSTLRFMDTDWWNAPYQKGGKE